MNRLLSLTGGWRYECFDTKKKGKLEPRFGFTVEFTPRFSLNASFGKYHQLPPFHILPIQKNLSPEKATHYILGFEYLLREDIKFSLETYYKKFQSMVISESDLRTEYSNKGEGFSRESNFLFIKNFHILHMEDSAIVMAYQREETGKMGNIHLIGIKDTFSP